MVFLDAFQTPLIQEAPPLQLLETSTASTTTEPVKIENNNFEQGNDLKLKCKRKRKHWKNFYHYKKNAQHTQKKFMMYLEQLIHQLFQKFKVDLKK